MNELNNMVLFDLFRNMFDRRWTAIQRELRHLRLQREIGDTFRFANAANERVEAYLDGTKACKHHPQNGGNCRFHGIPGNCDSRGGNLVQSPELCEGGDWGPEDFNGQRETACGFGDDVCDVGYWKERETFQTRWENCKSDQCFDRNDNSGCLGRQRAGMCSTQTRSRN